MEDGSNFPPLLYHIALGCILQYSKLIISVKSDVVMSELGCK